MQGNILFFAVFLVFIVGILMFDLLVVGRKSHEVSLREAASWTGVWVTLAMLFAVLLRFHGDMVYGIDSLEGLSELLRRYYPYLPPEHGDLETGLEIERLCARLDRMGEGRVLDDNATVLIDYVGGARGIYWSSQIAIGHDNGFRIRVYGTRGAFEWVQETPNTLKVSTMDRPVQLLSRGRDAMYPRAQALSRTPSGHPEGYFEAFANLYSTFIPALAKKIAGREPAGDELDFPGAADGIRGVGYIEKCVESSEKGAVWVDFA